MRALMAHTLVLGLATTVAADPCAALDDPLTSEIIDGPADGETAAAYSRGAAIPQTSRGGAAAATWIFRGDESR